MAVNRRCWIVMGGASSLWSLSVYLLRPCPTFRCAVPSAYSYTTCRFSCGQYFALMLSSFESLLNLVQAEDDLTCPFLGNLSPVALVHFREVVDPTRRRLTCGTPHFCGPRLLFRLQSGACLIAVRGLGWLLRLLLGVFVEPSSVRSSLGSGCSRILLFGRRLADTEWRVSASVAPRVRLFSDDKPCPPRVVSASRSTPQRVWISSKGCYVAGG